MFSLLYPYAYMALAGGWLIGIGVLVVCMGALSSTVLALMVLFGMIRIVPLLNTVNRITASLFSFLVPHLDANIRASFPVKGSVSTDRSILMWHPHGLFCTSHFFHIGTRLTDWPKGNFKAVALSVLTWMPFMTELFEYFHVIPSDYQRRERFR